MVNAFHPIVALKLLEVDDCGAGRARRGPTLRECILMHAVARLALTGYIDNVQASWVKMGPERAIQLMNVGCNDMGGSIMNETISKAAGDRPDAAQ